MVAPEQACRPGTNRTYRGFVRGRRSQRASSRGSSGLVTRALTDAGSNAARKPVSLPTPSSWSGQRHRAYRAASSDAVEAEGAGVAEHRLPLGAVYVARRRSAPGVRASARLAGLPLGE